MVVQEEYEVSDLEAVDRLLAEVRAEGRSTEREATHRRTLLRIETPLERATYLLHCAAKGLEELPDGAGSLPRRYDRVLPPHDPIRVYMRAYAGWYDEVQRCRAAGEL